VPTHADPGLYPAVPAAESASPVSGVLGSTTCYAPRALILSTHTVSARWFDALWRIHTRYAQRFVGGCSYMLSRDYMTLRFWDIMMSSRPIKAYTINEGLRSKLCDLCAPLGSGALPLSEPTGCGPTAERSSQPRGP
jgi:hypothetical protein